MPDFVPMWIEGLDRVMHETREFPRFIPRISKDISVTFGERVDMESTFGDLRERWRVLVKKAAERGADTTELGVVKDEELMHGAEAVAIRQEVTTRVRQEVLKVRRSRGLPDEDPKFGLVDTWTLEGEKSEGKMADGSFVKDT